MINLPAWLKSGLGFVVVVWAGSMAVPQATAEDWDFSEGSHERLIESFEQAHEARYHEIVAAYTDELQRRPNDPVLAVEQVRFMQNFAWSEDIFIESAEEDLERAESDLLARFPEAVSTVLYQMESFYADEFEDLVRTHELAVRAWTAEDRGAFYWYRAQRAQNDGELEETKRFAAIAFLNRPTPESALMLAESHLLHGDKPSATTVLQDDCFVGANAWYLKRRMDLWFDMGNTEAALAEFEALSATAEAYLVANEDTVGRLVAAGLVAQARMALDAMVVNDWNAIGLLRHRFEFERRHGTAESSKAAYETLRDRGWLSDPLARRRVELLTTHADLGWEWRDFSGVGGLVGLILILAAAPGLLLLPAHHWGLARRLAGKPPPLLSMGWTLRDTWVAAAVLMVASALAMWVFEIELLESYFDGQFREQPLMMKNIVGFVAISWGAMVLSLVWLLRKRRTWAMFKPGRWSWGEIIGVGFGACIALRMALGAYLVGQRALGMTGLAQAGPLISQLLVALQEQFGPWGMLVCISLVVPVLEEIYFRGVILAGLMRHIPFWVANLTQAALFGLVHENTTLFPFYVALGVVAGWLTKRSESLWPGIVLHMFNNLIAGIMVIVLSR